MKYIVHYFVILTMVMCALPIIAQKSIDAGPKGYSIGGLIDMSPSETGSSKWLQYYTYRSEIGATIPEMLPAWQDTNGNWGTQIDGMQLSLRFLHREYLEEEPISALVILRNVGLIPRSKWRYLDDSGYQFTVCHGTNIFRNIPTSKLPQDEGPRSYLSIIDSHSEEPAFVDFRKLFELGECGNYSVQAQIQVPASNGKGKTNVVSGIATFQIVKILSTDEIAARSAYARQLNDIQQRINELSRSNATPSTPSANSIRQP